MATKQEVKKHVDDLKKEIFNHYLHIKEKMKIIEKFKKIKKPNFFPLVENIQCTKECNGWDGIHNLCDCGNTLVEWDYDYLDDDVHPEVSIDNTT